MKYTGLTCTGCGREFIETDDVVVCPECGMPQHRSCWLVANGCVGKDNHGADTGWEMPVWKKKELEMQQKKLDDEKTEENRRRPNPYMGADDDIEIRFKNGEKSVKCPHCGSLNFGKDEFCLKCGYPLQENHESFSQAGILSGNGFSYINRESINLYGGISKDELIDGIPVFEHSVYIGGKKPGKFIRRFMMMERSGRKLTVNPAVILFGPIWYFYRKMYKLGVIFFALALLLTGVSVMASLDQTTVDYYREAGAITRKVYSGEISINDYNEELKNLAEKYEDMDFDIPVWRTALAYTAEFASIALYIFMIMKSDGFYRKKIKSDVDEIRARNSNMQDYLHDLEATGGYSIPLAVLGGVISVAIYLAQDIPAYYYMFF